MKIELDDNIQRYNRVDSYNTGSVTVNGVVYSHSVLLAPYGPVSKWEPQNFTDIASQHFNKLITENPELIILGTGRKLQFPESDIMSCFSGHQIGFEIMDTGAACRAYNVLINEGRNVLAALLMIESG